MILVNELLKKSLGTCGKVSGSYLKSFADYQYFRGNFNEIKTIDMKKKLMILAFVLFGALFYSCEDSYQEVEKETIEEVQATEDEETEDSPPQGCNCVG